MKIGLFIGRFQPFHLGHLNIIKTACKEVNTLVIGVGSSQESNTDKNPFSFDERALMIELTLKLENINNCEIKPIKDYPNDNKKWVREIKRAIPQIDIIYMCNKNSSGEQWIEQAFNNKYHIKKIKMYKNITGTLIRNNIKEDKPWKNLVHEKVYLYSNVFLVTKQIQKIII